MIVKTVLKQKLENLELISTRESRSKGGAVLFITGTQKSLADTNLSLRQIYMYLFIPVKMKIIYWSCPCVGLVRWLVGSLQIFLEVLFWMLSDVPHHYLRFETECHTDWFTCTYFLLSKWKLFIGLVPKVPNNPSYIFFTSQKVDLWSIWNSSHERVRTARASQSAGVANYPQECSSQKLHPELQMQQKLQVHLLFYIINGVTLHRPGMVLFSQVNFFAKLSTSAHHKNLQSS